MSRKKMVRVTADKYEEEEEEEGGEQLIKNKLRSLKAPENILSNEQPTRLSVSFPEFPLAK